MNASETVTEHDQISPEVLIQSVYPNGYETRSIIYGEDKKDGRSIETFAGEHEGEYLECYRENGQKIGLGLLYNRGKLQMKCQFKNNVIHGWGMIFEDGVAILEGYWVDGVFQKQKYVRCSEKEIVLEERDSDGVLVYRGGFESFSYLRQGYGAFYENGVLSRFGLFSDNQMICLIKSFDGEIMREYDDTGACIYEGHFLDDFTSQYPREGHGCEYIDGSLAYEGAFKNNTRDGYGTSYYNTGVASFKGMWRKGTPETGHHLNRNGFFEDVDFDGRFVFCVRNAPALEMLNETITSFTISDNCCNEESFDHFSLHEMPNLQEVVIGNNSCINVRCFTVVDLPQLESLLIGKDSFTKCDHVANKPWDHTNPDRIRTEHRILVVTECQNLRMISIGMGSFSDYSSVMIDKLDSLTSLILGDAEKTGYYERASMFGYFCEEFELKGRFCEITIA